MGPAGEQDEYFIRLNQQEVPVQSFLPVDIFF